MKSRRRNLRRHGGTSKFWGYAQHLRNRLGSMSFNGKKQPRERPVAHVAAVTPPDILTPHRSPVANKPVLSPNRDDCKEHDPQDTRIALPAWYTQKFFYYTGKYLRVLDDDEAHAYMWSKQYNDTSKKTNVYINYDGTVTFYIDEYHNFYIKKGHEDVYYRIVDLMFLYESTPISLHDDAGVDASPNTIFLNKHGEQISNHENNVPLQHKSSSLKNPNLFNSVFPTIPKQPHKHHGF